MFLNLNKKESPYWQVIYEVDGKRSKKSTRTKDKKEAEIFMIKFQLKQELNLTETNSKPRLLHSIKLSKFKEEYLEYCKSSKSKHYLESINLSFNQFIKFQKIFL